MKDIDATKVSEEREVCVSIQRNEWSAGKKEDCEHEERKIRALT
jgi:hypothetical protein